MSTHNGHADFNDPHEHRNGAAHPARQPDSSIGEEPDPKALDPNALDPKDLIAAYDPDALLHALAVLDFSPSALADQLNISPFALLDWFESENTQRQLTRYQALERQMLDLRAFKSRRLSIDNLEHVLETTQDLVEKRRTATTLLRLLTRPVGERERTPKRRGEASPASKPPRSEPGSASDHGDDTQRVLLPEGAQTPNQSSEHVGPSKEHAAQPPFQGSAQAEPPSESELKNKRASELSDKTESELKDREREQDSPNDQRNNATQEPNAEVNWDAFFPEAFKGHNGAAPPKPHQRE